MSINKYKSNKLRGLIANHVLHQRRLEVLGGHHPEDQDQIEAAAQKASDKLDNFIRKITKKRKHVEEQTSHAHPTQPEQPDGPDRVESDTSAPSAIGMGSPEIPAKTGTDASPPVCEEPKPPFQPGDVVIAICNYAHQITEGKEYPVIEYEPAYRDMFFTWPAYLTVLGDFGRKVTGHAHRFKLKD